MAVEPIARRLGATKGSFYWHFPDRHALLLAVLALYEEQGTEDVITDAEREAGPLEQLQRLFAFVFRNAGGDAVYHALLAHALDPDIAPVLRRVTERRIGYLTRCIAGAGYAPAEARQRALLAYTTWLGLAHA